MGVTPVPFGTIFPAARDREGGCARAADYSDLLVSPPKLAAQHIPVVITGLSG